ncbi:hypothetical protein Sjap_002764 [Stephania japonica]|uniref:Uncharacterized protein n=1 Tax=Stephania japonica TaxID=461633 RepID=A0AAP0KP81_9MAGN
MYQSPLLPFPIKTILANSSFSNFYVNEIHNHRIYCSDVNRFSFITVMTSPASTIVALLIERQKVSSSEIYTANSVRPVNSEIRTPPFFSLITLKNFLSTEVLYSGEVPSRPF